MKIVLRCLKGLLFIFIVGCFQDIFKSDDVECKGGDCDLIIGEKPGPKAKPDPANDFASISDFNIARESLQRDLSLSKTGKQDEASMCYDNNVDEILRDSRYDVESIKYGEFDYRKVYEFGVKSSTEFINFFPVSDRLILVTKKSYFDKNQSGRIGALQSLVYFQYCIP